MSFVRRGFSAQVLLLTSTVLIAPARAQVGAAVLIGRVLDAANKGPVADVVVTVTSTALQGEQIAVTDPSGSYRIPNLPPGSYAIRFEKESYRPFSRSTVSLRADSTIRIDAQLLPESLKAEEVVVVAQAPTVDVGSTNVGISLNKDLLTRVPLVAPNAKGAGSKSFEALAAATPGSQSDLYGTSIAGASSPENAFIIDGVSANNAAFGALGVPLSYEFVSEVNVIAGGYMPEYGRATGGVISAVTKSGGNEFHGGVWGDLTPGFLAADPKLARSESTVQMPYTIGSIWNLGLDFGGPIQKDKVWFYAGFQVARTAYDLKRTINASQVAQVGTDAAGDPIFEVVRDAEGFRVTNLVPGSEKNYQAVGWEYQALGKVTWSINPSNRLVASITATPSTSGGAFDSTGKDGYFGINLDSGQPAVASNRGNPAQGSYAAMADKRFQSAYSGIVNWTSEFNSKRLLWDTSLGWRHYLSGIYAVDGQGPGGDGLAAVPNVIFRKTSNPGQHSILEFQSWEPVAISPTACAEPNMAKQGALVCPVPQYYLGGPAFAGSATLAHRTLDQYSFKSVLTYFGQGLGHHVVKAGLESEYMTWHNIRAFPGMRRLREATNGNSFLDWRVYGFLRGPDDPVVLKTIDYTHKGLFVGGFLQDSWNILDKVTLNVGARYDSQFVFTNGDQLALTMPQMWSPRAGLIYDPTQLGRAKMYVNYARFYESIPLDIADRSLAGEPWLNSTYTSPPCDPRDADSLRQVCTQDASRSRATAGTSPDRTWGTALGGAVPVDPDLKPQSSDEFVGGVQYDVVNNLRAGVNYTKRWLNYMIEDMSRDGGQTYFIGNPGFGIAKDYPQPERNYDALTLSVHRGFRDQWQADASYTLSWLRGNYTGLFNPDTQQFDPNINSDFDLASLLANRSGYLPGDRRHQIRVFGSYDIPLPKSMHIVLGGSFSGRSGTPTNYLGSNSFAGPNEAFILPRGSGPRLPWLFSLDGHLGFGVQVWDKRTVEITMDVFNMANFQTEIARDQTYTAEDVLPIVDGTTADLPKSKDDPGKLSKETPGESFNVETGKNRNFGRATVYQAPRYFKFGIRATF